MIVFLDMDGVISDFNRAVSRVFEKNHDEVLNNWPKGEYNVDKVLGITAKEFWTKLDSIDTFWEDIEIFPYAHDLVDYLNKNFEMHICTSPSKHHSCLSGKSKWLKKHFSGKINRNVIITPQKHLLAQKNRVLIDDSDEKCDRFRQFDGNTILFPTLWGSNHELANVDKIDFVIKELNLIAYRENMK